jgi:hypothetical protein
MLALILGAEALCPASDRSWYSVWKACKITPSTDVTPQCGAPCGAGAATCANCKLTNTGATNLCNNNLVGLLRGPCRIALDALGRALGVCPTPGPSPQRNTDQYIGLLGNPPSGGSIVPTGLVPASTECLNQKLFGTYPRCPNLMGAWNVVWGSCGINVGGVTTHITHPAGPAGIPGGFMNPGLEYGGFPNDNGAPSVLNNNKNLLCESNRIPVVAPIGSPPPAGRRFAPSKCRRALNTFGAAYSACNAAIRTGDPLASMFNSLIFATTPANAPSCARS